MGDQKNFFGAFDHAEREHASRWLASKCSTSPNARRFNESHEHRAESLLLLRRGQGLTDVAWKDMHPGSRLAPTIEKLRNAHGFSISGDGSVSKPYRLDDVNQMPRLVAVTDEIKAAYYASAHWQSMRMRRMQLDKYACLLCGVTDDLQVHHILYRLFAESLAELMTLCRECHDRIHEYSRLAFPSGIDVDSLRCLGIEPSFESWLLPEGVIQ